MGDLIIKPEAGGSIKLQNNAGTDTLVSDNAGNVTLAGSVTFAGSTTISSGTISAGTIGSGVTFPAGHVIKATHHTNTTRTSLGTASSTTARVVLWNFTVNKAISASDLYVTASLSWHEASNGNSSWFIKENSGSWISMGGTNTYVTTYNSVMILIGKVPASDTAAGNNSIDIGWSSGTGKPYSIWNPNTTDQANEQVYQAPSHLIVTEIMI